MPSTTRTDGPLHMAGRPHRSSGYRSRGAAAPATPAAPAGDAEVAPPARVHRSRLAFAMAVTVAALPILVLDNFPATADPVEDTGARVEVTASDAPTTTEAPVAVEVAALPADASPATEATTTTEAPTTTTPPVVRAQAAPAPPTTPPTTEAPAPSGAYGDPNDPATWDRMAQCEAGGNWAANTGNGYYGGLQFSLSTWHAYGGTGYPHQASRATQIETGKRLQAAEGWGAWPACSEKLGYR